MDILVGRIIWLYVANLGSQSLESTMASSSSRSAMGRRRGRRSRVELPMPTERDRSQDRVDEQTCPSSEYTGQLSLFYSGGSSSPWFDVKPLVVDGASGGFGW